MNSETTFDVYSEIVFYSLYIFCLVLMLILFSTVLSVLDTTEGQNENGDRTLMWKCDKELEP